MLIITTGATTMLDMTAAAFSFINAMTGRDVEGVRIIGDRSWPSVFATTDLAVASIAAAGVATRALIRELGGPDDAEVVVDRDLASLWFAVSIFPEGWDVGPVWDAYAGDYATSDGWIRLHTNAPHHRRAALRCLGLVDGVATKDDVTAAVSSRAANDLEDAVVRNGGCAAAMRSADEWVTHDHGRTIANEPLIHRDPGSDGPLPSTVATPDRPLAGVRVLDLTRVLAGPVCTRFLAGLGADVLRIDPPDWDEPTIAPEVTLGKRCGRLDLRDADDLATLRQLLSDADIVVHGYRADALAGAGLDHTERARLAPGLVDVSLNAYGWTGPWTNRRGFDSLVQMSAGIAHAGMVAAGSDRPKPLPVQALDHATGYLMAAAAIDGWAQRLRTRQGARARMSLARTAALLSAGPPGSLQDEGPDVTAAQLRTTLESTVWGPARRLRPPMTVGQTTLHWDRPANPLGSEPPPLRWRGGR